MSGSCRRKVPARVPVWVESCVKPVVRLAETLPAGKAPLFSLTARVAVVSTGTSLTEITFITAVFESAL